MPLPRPSPTNLLGDPGYELDLVLDQYADEIEATSAAIPGKLDATDAALGAAIAGASSKATPVDGDNLLLADSAASDTAKRLTWANLKTAIAAALDGVFARLAGIAGGQTLTGGTAASENLTLRSTAHATKGKLLLGTSAYDEATNRLGVGVAAPTAALHLKAGSATASTAPIKLTGGTLLTTPEAGAIEYQSGRLYFTDDSPRRSGLATESWLTTLLGGCNLVANGGGHLREVRPFSSSYTLDLVDCHSSALASFLVNLANVTLTMTESIPVTTGSRIRVAFLAKSGDIGGGNFNPANKQFIGLQFYDRDDLRIDAEHSEAVPGSVDTTLALPLNPGDTTITLSSAAGWHNGSTADRRSITWFGYQSSSGYVYPDYTYSRNRLHNGWPAGGISGNTITLSSPWAGPALPAGAAVRNSGWGKAFNFVVNGSIVPNTWTRYEAIFAGLGTLNTNFRHGTAAVRFAHIVNQNGVADNNIRICAITINTLSSAALEPQIGIGATYKDMDPSNLPANGLAVEGFVGVGTSAPSRRLHVMGTAPQARIGVDASNYTDISSAGSSLAFSGALLWSPGASVTPSVNGQITLELTSNTTLTIRAKGSDGTVRSAAITLS